MKKIFVFLVSIFATASAFATPFYVDGFAGFNFVSSYKGDSARIDVQPGFVGGGAVGYRFSKFFRVEGEGAFRTNRFDQIVVEEGSFPASGYIRTTTALANGIIEIPLSVAVVPYFGGGFGKRWFEGSFVIDPIDTPEGTYFFDTIEGTGHELVYQGLVGLIFCRGQKIQAAVEYRYLDGRRMTTNHALNLNLKRYF